MNRRDFLTLRTDKGRVMELSCQRLYMWYLDTQITSKGSRQLHENGSDRCAGEPPAVFDDRTIAQLFRGLEHDLLDVEVLRIRDKEWLIHEDLARELEELLSAFRLRSGRVEFLD